MPVKKKIVLLGASGQLGRAFQNFFADRDDVILMPFTSGQLDITQSTKLKSVINEQEPNMLINCAAYTNVDKAEEDFARARLVNAAATKAMAHSCSTLNIKLIHFSTDYIFAGNKEDRARFPNGYAEDHPANPINAYGQSKWEGEQAIRESNCPHIILRISWLCGLHGNNFITTMLRLASDRARIKVVDDQMGSPTFAFQLAGATWKLISEQEQGTFHYTSGGLLSWADFAEAIFRQSKSAAEVQRISSSEFSTAAKRPAFSKLNTHKIAQLPDIKIQHWQNGLTEFLNQLNKTN